MWVALSTGKSQLQSKRSVKINALSSKAYLRSFWRLKKPLVGTMTSPILDFVMTESAKRSRRSRLGGCYYFTRYRAFTPRGVGSNQCLKQVLCYLIEVEISQPCSGLPIYMKLFGSCSVFVNHAATDNCSN